MPNDYAVDGTGIVEEIKILPSGVYAIPRVRLVLRLESHGDSLEERLYAQQWEKQRKVLLTVRFGRGLSGELEAEVFCAAATNGAKIRFSALVKQIEAPRNPGEFDYARYLWTKGVYSAAEADGDSVAVVGEASALQRFFAISRQKLASQPALYLDAKGAAVVSGCFLGDLSSMAREDKDIYRDAGIYHLFSVSGTHGGILLAAALHLDRISALRKKPWVSRALALVLLYFYLALTGFPLSMWRTFLMACLTRVAPLLRKKGDALDALAAAAAVLLLLSPQRLFGAGFQLSFGVTWGLIHLGPWLRKYLPPWLAVPVSAQLAAMPIQVFWFYQIQPFGALANICAVALMPPMLLLSGVAAFTGLAFPALGGLLWQAPGFLAMLLHRGASLWTALPFAVVNIGDIPWPICALVGMAIWMLPGWRRRSKAFARWLYQRYAQKKRQDQWRQWEQWHQAKKGQMLARQTAAARRLFVPTPNMQSAPDAPDTREETLSTFSPKETKPGLALILWTWRIPIACGLAVSGLLCWLILPKPLHIAFLDVGQGDCVYIKTPSGKVWLSDAGSSTVTDLAYYRLEPFLRSRGVNRIDYILVSHPDLDHISGIFGLLEAGWAVGHLIMAPQSADTEAGKALATLAGEQGARVVSLSAGQSIRDGEVHLRCLYPEEGMDWAAANDISLVVELRYRDFSLLLTGDIDLAVESALEGAWPRATMLKTAHHGSKNSSGEAFLAAVAPKAAVISCSKRNLYGHPHPDTLARLAECGSLLYLTMDSGAIKVRTDGRNLWIRGFLAQ